MLSPLDANERLDMNYYSRFMCHAPGRILCLDLISARNDRSFETLHHDIGMLSESNATTHESEPNDKKSSSCTLGRMKINRGGGLDDGRRRGGSRKPKIAISIVKRQANLKIAPSGNRPLNGRGRERVNASGRVTPPPAGSAQIRVLSRARGESRLRRR